MKYFALALCLLVSVPCFAYESPDYANYKRSPEFVEILKFYAHILTFGAVECELSAKYKDAPPEVWEEGRVLLSNGNRGKTCFQKAHILKDRIGGEVRAVDSDGDGRLDHAYVEKDGVDYLR